MKKILLTGCNGQLGRALQAEYKAEDAMLICTDVKELDISDHAQVMQYVRKLEPETMFEEGIRKTIRWYFEHEDWMEHVTSGDYRNYYKEMYKDS